MILGDVTRFHPTSSHATLSPQADVEYGRKGLWSTGDQFRLLRHSIGLRRPGHNLSNAHIVVLAVPYPPPRASLNSGHAKLAIRQRDETGMGVPLDRRNDDDDTCDWPDPTSEGDCHRYPSPIGSFHGAPTVFIFINLTVSVGRLIVECDRGRVVGFFNLSMYKYTAWRARLESILETVIQSAHVTSAASALPCSYVLERKTLQLAAGSPLYYTKTVYQNAIGELTPLTKLEDIGDSLDILMSTSQRQNLDSDPAAVGLARLLNGLPLALPTAGTCQTDR
ncbi:hypothetical protein EDB80DRAFT_690906 [Ilyonectria destructans]|nr:hypothetical protein EDB80DRAFT_690906 [Ilyonectria destructans]